MNDQETKPTAATNQGPTLDQIRHQYLQTDHERAMLDRFIAAGWTAQELGEFARTFILTGRTRPTASSYQMAISGGPDGLWARGVLTRMRQPDYGTIPPFDRVDPDDPRYAEHGVETRANIENLAWRFMARELENAAARKEKREVDFRTARETARDLRKAGNQIPRRLWRKAYQALDKHDGDITKATISNELWMYA